MKKQLHQLLLGLGVLLFLGICHAQNPSQCISKIQTRLDTLKAAGDTNFDFHKAFQTVKEFDFGKTADIVNNSQKATAYKRIWTSMSEFSDLAPNDISGKAYSGYTKFSGGIIRADGTDFVDELRHVFGGSTSFDGPGFSKVMEQLDNIGQWVDQFTWKSSGGLVYKSYDVTTNGYGHRITHVFDHTVSNPSKPTTHSVFSDSRDKILDLVDEAFSKGQPHSTDTLRLEAELGRVVGTAGETKMRIIVNPNTKEIITAFPIADADVSVPGL